VASSEYAPDSPVVNTETRSLRGDDSIRLAFLSWVHLLLFAELGYAYVFSGGGRAARTALRSFSTGGLSRAFFFVREGYEGEMEPVVAGVLVRLEGPEFRRTSFIGVAGEIGRAIVALPIDDDHDGLYSRLGDFMSDGSLLFVIPLATLFDGHEPVLRGIASYGLEREDGRIDRLFRPDVGAVLADIGSATGLTKGRQSRKPSGGGSDEPHWPPTPLELPLEPRDETWRATATRYLNRRAVTASACDGSDESWIEAVREQDVVAARHLEDMRDLFQLGADPESRPKLRFSFLEELNQAVADRASRVRVTAFTAHATEPAVKPFASMACHIRVGDHHVVCRAALPLGDSRVCPSRSKRARSPAVAVDRLIGRSRDRHRRAERRAGCASHPPRESGGRQVRAYGEPSWTSAKMFPSGSLNHAPRLGPSWAIPSIVLGESYSSNVTPRARSSRIVSSRSGT